MGRTIVLLEHKRLRSLVNKLPDDRRLFVLVALRPAHRFPENDFISFRPKSLRYACAKCMHPAFCSNEARSFANCFLNIRLHRKQLKETMCTIRIRMTSTGFYHRQKCVSEFIYHVE